ncbi:hypothetical protein [Actinophytocola sp.]|uniref:hypothetical protein n=1 Tax=Actinophytocola sp. TaxID=1872138 RepID=UPI002ED693D5
MTVSHERIAVLWNEHLRRPFPPRLRGKDIDGIDFVLLDADIAGCVSAWLSRQGDLDPDRQRILRECLDDLHRLLLPSLTDQAERHYYSALGDLAQAVLETQQEPR